MFENAAERNYDYINATEFKRKYVNLVILKSLYILMYQINKQFAEIRDTKGVDLLHKKKKSS